MPALKTLPPIKTNGKYRICERVTAEKGQSLSEL